MGQLSPNSVTLVYWDTSEIIRKQECIPVGCVPADRRPYAGVCFPEGGVSGPGGSPSGVVTGPGGLSMPGGSGKENPPPPSPREQNDRQV